MTGRASVLVAREIVELVVPTLVANGFSEVVRAPDPANLAHLLLTIEGDLPEDCVGRRVIMTFRQDFQNGPTRISEIRPVF